MPFLNSLALGNEFGSCVDVRILRGRLGMGTAVDLANPFGGVEVGLVLRVYVLDCLGRARDNVGLAPLAFGLFVPAFAHPFGGLFGGCLLVAGNGLVWVFIA